VQSKNRRHNSSYGNDLLGLFKKQIGII